VLTGLAPGANITPAAINLLASHHWPGNFRELRAVLTRALLARGATEAALDAPDLHSHLPVGNGAGLTGASSLRLSATELVLREFERTGHNISLTSRNLAISRTTVYRHLRDGKSPPPA
jgi:transcriptional regulator of acetoin/glycerol metabolism